MRADLRRIVLRGDPRARGCEYGTRARRKIVRCIESYRHLFRYRAGLEWEAALAHARTFERHIAEFLPDGLLEMRGIAEGAGVAFDHILALNCRSELMFAATGRLSAPPGECTSVAVTPEASAQGHSLLAQNWDWVPFAREVCVLLEVRREDKPSFATVVEAGMLAKVGVNAAGLGLCTNTLVSQRDVGAVGVPYHVMLRALLDAESVGEARALLHAPPRALSANYLVADRSGEAENFETIAGGAREVRATRPHGGLLAHSNHFLASEFSAIDAYLANSRHSLTRLSAMWEGLRTQPALTVDRLQELLRGHEHAPNGICSHPDPSADPLYARCTVASVIADLTTGEVWLAAGPPCSTPYATYSLTGIGSMA